jgi:citrate/tricarballylate utilization protein
MPESDLIKDGARQLTICNACRYCEGYCAVFPALERRRVFTKADLTYLANLCFDCRDCYYACQYAPPHEFAVNIPKLMAQLRADTYEDFSWPAISSSLFKHNAIAASAITFAMLSIIFVLAWSGDGTDNLFRAHLGAGAFYRVVPYLVMTVAPLLIVLFGCAVLLAGAWRFWRDTKGNVTDLLDAGAFWRATQDAFGLVYLNGGGAGCNYPDAAFSQARRWLHHLVFYGFLMDFASTTVAAFYDHILKWPAPYPLLSPPVVLGTTGGIALLIGSCGLLCLKRRSDAAPSDSRMLRMDTVFLLMLLLTTVTGLLLLALRESAAMGTLLVIHLAVVAGLFITMPYGKFAHVVYRYAALVRYAIEQRRQP